MDVWLMHKKIQIEFNPRIEAMEDAPMASTQAMKGVADGGPPVLGK